MLKEKWYILNIDTKTLLRWNTSTLYFDTKPTAQRFLDHIYAMRAVEGDYIVIKQHYNNSNDNLNATNLICIQNGDTLELVPAD